MPGIDPGTLRMRSECSTIWATSPDVQVAKKISSYISMPQKPPAFVPKVPGPTQEPLLLTKLSRYICQTEFSQTEAIFIANKASSFQQLLLLILLINMHLQALKKASRELINIASYRSLRPVPLQIGLVDKATWDLVKCFHPRLARIWSPNEAWAFRL